MLDELLLPDTRAAIAGRSTSWFVYLITLTDCTAFKAGFSCNPLQRIYSFSRRYFERFDLRESQLLTLPDCDAARAIEAAVKTELAGCRMECPSWVPHAAGGRTEWFSAVQFGRAQARLREMSSAPLVSAFDFIRPELRRLSPQFESWAWRQSQQTSAHYADPDAWKESRRTLREWLDAYRYFELPLFEDDRDVQRHVLGSH